MAEPVKMIKGDEVWNATSPTQIKQFEANGWVRADGKTEIRPEPEQEIEIDIDKEVRIVKPVKRGPGRPRRKARS